MAVLVSNLSDAKPQKPVAEQTSNAVHLLWARQSNTSWSVEGKEEEEEGNSVKLPVLQAGGSK